VVAPQHVWNKATVELPSGIAGLGAFKPNSALKAAGRLEAAVHSPLLISWISRREEMTLQITDTAVHFEFKQNEGATSINGGCGRGEVIIIAGAISEWVLVGLQQWRRVARQSATSCDLSERPRAGGEM
jgi:hypothetical protein